MLSFAPDGLITADPGNIKKTHCMCRAKLSQHCANDRMRGRFRVVRNETDVHLIATRLRAQLRLCTPSVRSRSQAQIRPEARSDQMNVCLIADHQETTTHPASDIVRE